MVKRAGVIVGLCIIVLAILVYVLTLRLSAVRVSEPVVRIPTPPVGQPVAPPATGTATAVFREIALSALQSNFVRKNEIMVVARKKLVLLDGAVGTSGNKQLHFGVDLRTASDTVLTLFLSEEAFTGVIVGDRLNVVYKVYRNDVGTEFPVIVSVNKVR